MYFLVLSICCSVAVSILLKVARQHGIGLSQAITVNYMVAALLCIALLQPNFSHWQQNVLPQAWLFILLGVLLPSIFIVMGRAVATAGIVKTDAAQRLSLFISVFCAFAFLGEALTQKRLGALILAFTALICLTIKPSKRGESGQALWLLGVWLGYGTIDVLLKMLSKANGTGTNLLILFILAGILMTVWLKLKGLSFKRNDWIGGALLGCLNFCNIWFYIQAHRVFPQNPTLVFASMNMGVIVLGTLVGAAAFHEKINRINALGIILALVALYCLYFL